MLTDLHASNLIPVKYITRKPSNEGMKPSIYILGLSEMKLFFLCGLALTKRPQHWWERDSSLVVSKEDQFSFINNISLCGT